MARLIPGDNFMIVAKVLIFSIWVVTPLCWALLLSRIAYVCIAYLWSFSFDPFQNHLTLQHLYPSSHPYLSRVLLAYSSLEACFSIYYQHLVRTVQLPGPRPLYGRRFLRSVFARALESGLLENVSENAYTTAAATSRPSSYSRSNGHATSRTDFIDHKPHQYEPQEHESRQRLGRLRRASLVPAFVHRPLTPQDPRAIKFRQWQARWFFDAPFDHITQRDAQQWLSWSLFGTSLEELETERDSERKLSQESSPCPPSVSTFESAHFQDEDLKHVQAVPGEWDPTKGDRLQFLEYCMELLEARQGRSFPKRSPRWQPHHEPHNAPLVRMMRLTMDPVRVVSRPLIVYAVTNALSAYTISKTIRGGFQYRTEGRLPYLIRTPDDWDPKTSKIPPLIVLHGLGIGLSQYASLVEFFLTSKRFQNRPIMILLQPNISQNIFSADFLKPFGHHETTDAFRRIIDRQRWNHSGITVLSHSYGTIVHSWLIKSFSSLIRRSCFVDPVCFQLWVPFVCGNFLYKRADNSIELLMRYFVAREVATAHTLCRHFDWSSNILWPDEIPNLCDSDKTQFFLAEVDAILSAPDTRDYLIETGIPSSSIHYALEKAHGEMLLKDGPDFERIVQWLLKEV